MTRPLNMVAHGDWGLLANMRKPLDISAAVRQLAAHGLKPHDIAASLHIGVAAVEKALQEAETIFPVSA